MRWTHHAGSLVALTLLTGALLPAASWAEAVQDGSIPREFTDPTGEVLAGSVHVWDPAGSVHTWDVAGHVSAIETRTTEGEESVLRLDSDILFGFGSAELPPAAAPTIASLVGDVPAGAVVTVTGHTDDIGSDAENLVLSRQRAEAVAAVIGSARGDLVLEVDGRGEAEPVASNAEDAGREANRRVEVRYRG